MQDGTVHIQEGLDLDQDPLVLANQQRQDLDQDPLVLVIDPHDAADPVHNSVDNPSSYIDQPGFDSLTTNTQLGDFAQAGEDFITLSSDHTQVGPIPLHPMT